MSAATEPRVCVVIVSYNSQETLPRCIASLVAQTYKDFRLILIDNASREKPGRLLEGLPFPVTYMEMTENLGFAGAMAAALEATTSPLLAALNPDAFANTTWLAELVVAADAYPKVAAFGSMQIDAKDPTHIDGFGDNYLIWGPAWRGQGQPSTGARYGISYCFGVCAAAALFRTDVLRRAGGFDRRFFCFYEDVDASFRLRLAGHECAVVGSAVVEHVGGASFQDQSDFAQFLIARNQWWVMLKNLPLPLLVVAVPGFLLMQSYGFVRHAGSPRMKGLWAGLKQTGTFLAARSEVQRNVSTLEIGRWLTWWPGAFFRKATIVRPARGG